MMILTSNRFPGTLAEDWAGAKPGLNLYWLGQAGFAVVCEGLRLVIDHYLSDHLGQKYANSDVRHERLMPSPIEPAKFGDLQFVFVTHEHGDHMDPVTLASFSSFYPSCRFIVPAAELEFAGSILLTSDRLTGADANRPLVLDEQPLPRPNGHCWPIPWRASAPSAP